MHIIKTGLNLVICVVSLSVSTVCTVVLEVSTLVVEIIVVASWVVGITVVVCEAEVTTVVENADVSEYCDVYDVVDLIIYINMTVSTKNL